MAGNTLRRVSKAGFRVRLLQAAMRRGELGPYQLQACIAAVHALAPDADRTDWEQIAALYGRLASVMRSPVVELNRAVAVAMSEGPEAGLLLIDEIAVEGALEEYHLLHSARADLFRSASRPSAVPTSAAGPFLFRSRHWSGALDLDN